MPTLSQGLREYVAGCFTGIWVESQEPQEAILEIAQLCRDESWQFVTWNIDQGLRAGGDAGSTGEMTDPLAAVKASQAVVADATSIIVLENFHRFLSSVEIIQAIASRIHAGKQTRSILVILSPQVDLPPELEKLFVVVEHAMPDREQLKEICLLYTSPSPRDQRGSRMPSSA